MKTKNIIINPVFLGIFCLAFGIFMLLPEMIRIHAKQQQVIRENNIHYEEVVLKVIREAEKRFYEIEMKTGLRVLSMVREELHPKILKNDLIRNDSSKDHLYRLSGELLLSAIVCEHIVKDNPDISKDSLQFSLMKEMAEKDSDLYEQASVEFNRVSFPFDSEVIRLKK